MNVIQNPQFIFDIRRSDSVDCCLAVIASAFIDSCSQSEHQLTKVVSTDAPIDLQSSPRDSRVLIAGADSDVCYLRQGGGKSFCPCLFVCLSVCMLARLLKNAYMDFDEMLRVDRCRDTDKLINF